MIIKNSIINYQQNKYISFKGVIDNRNKNNGTPVTFDDLFNLNASLSKDEADFFQDFIDRERKIKNEYTKKIAAVRENFIGKLFNSAQKKRDQLMEERDKALSIAYEFQDAFEKREKEMIELKKKCLFMAQQLNYSQDLIITLQRKQAESIRRQEIIEKRKKSLSTSGFSKLAGYQKEKDILTTNFIDSIDDEQAGKNVDVPIPNAILFYGPTGCGKSTFAKALAEESGCHFEKINCYGSQQEKEKKLKEELNNDILEESKLRFEKENKRTIILIDEFDRFFGDDVSPEFIRMMKSIMSSCSDNNHATLFLATNSPQKIPYELINQHRTGIIVNLDPPDKENSKAVMEHYFKECDKDKLDYDKITDRLFKRAPDEVYSNSQLQNICEIATDEIKPLDEKLDTNMVLQAIENYDDSSDNPEMLRLTKPYLENYNNDKEMIGASYADS